MENLAHAERNVFGEFNDDSGGKIDGGYFQEPVGKIRSSASVDTSLIKKKTVIHMPFSYVSSLFICMKHVAITKGQNKIKTLLYEVEAINDFP